MKERIASTLGWILVAAIVSFVLAASVIYITSSQESEEQMGSYQPVPVRIATVAKRDTQVAAKKKPLTIRSSPAVQVYIPSGEESLTISSKVYPLVCMPEIDPPRSGPLVGSVFSCSDFAQPSTNSSGLTILSGHSSVGLDAAFNRLNLMGKEARGKEVWVRTRASGKRWLVYGINSIYRPLKQDLPYMAKIWGKPGQSLPGRLVLVTCYMKEDGSVADYNLIMVAQLKGVR